MFTNKLRKIRAEERPALNGWLSIGSSFTAEIMAAQGYDALTIDIQHGALDYASALTMLQAMRGSDVMPMVRVPWREPGIIMKALDAGAQGIICPMINSAREAAEFVSYLDYPPEGQRSSGPTRAAFAYGGYGLGANDEVLGFAMPGVGIQGFARKALQMAQAGIYDLRIHHDEILWPLLRYWNLFDLEGLPPEAEQARDRLAAHLAKTDRLASRFEAKRMRAAEAQARAS